MTRHNTRQRPEDARRATHAPPGVFADPGPHNATQQPTQQMVEVSTTRLLLQVQRELATGKLDPPDPNRMTRMTARKER